MSDLDDIRIGRFPAFQCNQRIISDPKDEIEQAAQYRKDLDPDELIDRFSLNSIVIYFEPKFKTIIIIPAKYLL